MLKPRQISVNPCQIHAEYLIVLLCWKLISFNKNVNYHEHFMFHKLRTYLRTWQPDVCVRNHYIRTYDSPMRVFTVWNSLSLCSKLYTYRRYYLKFIRGKSKVTFFRNIADQMDMQIIGCIKVQRRLSKAGSCKKDCHRCKLVNTDSLCNSFYPSLAWTELDQSYPGDSWESLKVRLHQLQSTSV